MRTSFNRNCFVFMAFAALLSACSGKQEQLPNILFIFADDQSYNTFLTTGNDGVRTPNLDRLAARGTSFTHAYNMGAWNGAVCIASRAMINTGRFVWRAEAASSHLEDLAERGQLWSLVMREAGYETYFSGKWHVKIDPELIFDHVRHVRPGMPRTVPRAYNRPLPGQEDPWSPYDTTLGGFWEGGKHWSEVLADDAEEFLQTAGSSDQPFFMYLAFNAPHDPRQSPESFIDMYPVDQVSLPPGFLPRYPYASEMGCGESLRDERLAPFPRTEEAVRVHRQEYFAIISHMDQQVGRILGALEESGKLEHTYVFFTADHGLSVGDHGLMGKQNQYDHSIRVPLLVAGPGVPGNNSISAGVYLQDIMATAIDLAGVDQPGYVEFNSLLPLINKNQNQGNYPELYGCYRDRQRMIRSGRYKLVAYPYAVAFRLYDMNEDPFELNDLSALPGNQPLVDSLYESLKALMNRMDDTLDLDSFYLNEPPNN